jgi:hypothetical protein
VHFVHRNVGPAKILGTVLCDTNSCNDPHLD